MADRSDLDLLYHPEDHEVILRALDASLDNPLLRKTGEAHLTVEDMPGGGEEWCKEFAKKHPNVPFIGLCSSSPYYGPMVVVNAGGVWDHWDGNLEYIGVRHTEGLLERDMVKLYAKALLLRTAYEVIRRTR